MEEKGKREPMNEYQERTRAWTAKDPNVWSRSYALQGYEARTLLVEEFAWAIPNEEAVNRIAEFFHDLFVVEIGAGTGYWASLLDEAGVSIECFDIAPKEGGFFLVHEGGPEKIEELRAEGLFLCWPPYDTSMARACLRHFGGNKLVYVGEAQWGCTGDLEFHQLLDSDWSLVEHVYIPNWPGISDKVHLYVRK